MTDQNRFGDDRDDDRRRQDGYRGGDPYGGSYGQERYPEGPGLRTYEGASRYGGDRSGQGYGGQPSSAFETRSFMTDSGYDAYSGAAGYGEENYRNRRYGSGEGGYGYNNRDASGSMLHQGYRGPSGAGSQDRSGYRSSSAAGDYQGGYDRRRLGDTGYGGRGSQSYGGGYSNAQGPGGERGFWDQTRDEVASWFGDDEAARRRRTDSLRDGQHRGRGPKGYTRSDDRIREDVNDRLTDDHLLDASDIEVKVDGGEVTLSGHIGRREDKRRAEDLAEQVTGVKHVQNNLRVKDGAVGGDAGSATGTSAGTTTGATASARSN